jgi:hypothetical protein
MELTKDSLPFITGMGYRKMCDFIYDEFYKVNITEVNQFDGMKIFVKTDFLFEFISNVLPNITNKFFLYSHNSDECIDDKYFLILNNDNLLTWFGQNVNTINDKLKSIPIGIANRRWPHGNIEILQKVIDENNTKDNLIYCNIDVNTNISERSACLEAIYPIQNSNKVSFEEYLRIISKTYFIISPNGNGIDCHKTWESMYLNAIPIVTNSINISHYKDYPILIIDNWSDLKDIELNVELYNKIMEKYENFNNGVIS